MKKFPMVFGALFMVSLFFPACGEDGYSDDHFDQDEKVAIADLPQSILDYVSENYPDSSIKEAEREKEDGNVVYEIELNTGEELIFDENGEFLKLDHDDDDHHEHDHDDDDDDD